jgi:hypothetical protein
MEGETESEMVRRHVREGEGHVKRQTEVIARLQKRGASTDMAKALLDRFNELQHLHLAHLARVEARPSLPPDSRR